MLATQTKQLNSTFERIVRDKNGVLVRVRFIVVEVNGKLEGQIVSATPVVSEIVSKTSVSSNHICLPVIKESKVIVSDSTPSFVSKIFPTEFLEFFMSQPTRAPSFRV